MSEILLANGAWVTPVAYVTFVFVLLVAALATRKDDRPTSAGPEHGSMARSGLLFLHHQRPVWTPARRAHRFPRPGPGVNPRSYTDN